MYVTDAPRPKVELAKYTLVNLSLLESVYSKFRSGGDVVVNVGEIDKNTFLARSVRDPSIEAEVNYSGCWGNYDSLQRAGAVISAIRSGIQPFKEPLQHHKNEVERIAKEQREMYRDVLVANET